MAKQDYYDTLGVTKQADTGALKKAYRKLAMEFHPDRNQGDAKAEQKFKEISEAYDVLKDDQKRSAYDRYGHAAFENGRQGAGGQAGGFEFGSGFADVFDEMFGDSGGARRSGGGAARGSDLRYNLEITLEQAYRGRETKLKIPASVSCDTCDGSGANPGSRPTNCGMCQGRGKVRAQQGFFTIERTCPTCGGIGQVIEDPCKACTGSGRVRREKTLAVTIPQGVEEGTRIRLAGEGEAGLNGATSGDLYIFINVSGHGLFEREATTLFCRVPIPMSTASLGGTVEVPTIDGTLAKVTIPSGTQSARQFRLRGKGMTGLHGRGRGDMYIEIQVETPVNLTKRQQELLREFETENKGGNRSTSPESEGFFAKVKELWEDLTE
jgi:molecular chaperone DnaJ